MAADPKRRGRPRSEKAREAILAAATDLLLQHGLDAVSMDELAEVAGVSKATIYRWWPSKQVLALDVLLNEWPTASPRSTGTLRGDLLSLLRPWVKRLGQRPYARVIAALIATARSDRAFGELWRERFVAVRREPGRIAFTRAVERGEIPAETDVELALDLLYGSLYHRMLHDHAPLTERLATRVVDAALYGVLALPRSA
jgi:AcrR family transcriptional regulator